MELGVYGDLGLVVINVVVADDNLDIGDVTTLLQRMEVKSALVIQEILKCATQRNAVKTSGRIASAGTEKRRKNATKVTLAEIARKHARNALLKPLVSSMNFYFQDFQLIKISQMFRFNQIMFVLFCFQFVQQSLNFMAKLIHTMIPFFTQMASQLSLMVIRKQVTFRGYLCNKNQNNQKTIKLSVTYLFIISQT